MRARMALHVAGTKYEHREIILRDKPEAMLAASPKGSVPVFILEDGKVIDESLDVMRWALPSADLDTNIISMIDGPFKNHLDRYKYASRYDDSVKRGDVDLAHRKDAVSHLSAIENQLIGSDYLSGPNLSPTDMASFPFVRQFAAVEPEWWASEEQLARTRNWLFRCMSSDLFAAIMVKHKLWVPTP